MRSALLVALTSALTFAWLVDLSTGQPDVRGLVAVRQHLDHRGDRVVASRGVLLHERPRLGGMRRVGQDHHQPVDAHAEPAGGRHAQLERLQRLNLSQTGIEELSAVLKLGDLGLLRVSGNPDLSCESIAEAIREYGRDAVTFDQNCMALRNRQN